MSDPATAYHALRAAGYEPCDGATDEQALEQLAEGYAVRMSLPGATPRPRFAAITRPWTHLYELDGGKKRNAQDVPHDQIAAMVRREAAV